MLFIRRREGLTSECLSVGGLTLPDCVDYDSFVIETLKRLEKFLITNIHLMDYTFIGIPTLERMISYQPKYTIETNS